MKEMNQNYKGLLQEYCQANCIPLPEYHVLNESGPAHSPTFQVEVKVNGEYFTDDVVHLTKKKAEQAAAEVAYNALNSPRCPPTQQSCSSRRRVQSPSNYSPLVRPAILPSSSASFSSRSINSATKHMPDRYIDSERFIINIINSEGGRIRKIWSPNEHGEYQLEITGTYRYCENVGRHHQKNHICFIVNPARNIYYQKCHNPECIGFQSSIKRLQRRHEETTSRKRRDDDAWINNSKRFKEEEWD